jgi:UDPglucose 6-dehydrogenase
MAGYDFSFLRGAIQTNDEQFERVVGKVEAAIDGTGGLAGARLGVWGLTFKAGTDDLRNSPAVEVVKRLVEGGAEVVVFDPTLHFDEEDAHTIDDLVGADPGSSGSVRVAPDAYAACEGAAAVVVLTEWDQFRWLDFEIVRSKMGSPVVVDARNLLDPAQLRRYGFEYTGIGRR